MDAIKKVVKAAKRGKKSNRKDPHAKREAAKYDNPIPSREFILEVLDAAPGPLTHEALCEVLDLQDPEPIEALRRRLIAMSRDGQLISNRRQGYMPVDQRDLIRGRIQGHKDGFGFLIPADGGEDIFLSHRQMRKVFDGDEAVVRLTHEDQRGKLEGAIVEVLAHHTHQVVGRLVTDHDIQFVRPDNARLGHDILIPPKQHRDAASGQFVVVEITQQPQRDSWPVGRVLEVLGDHMAPGMEIDVAIRSHGIPHLWPADVQAEAARLPAEVVAGDKKKRIDLRQLPLVTIDGEDARDFDDAVYCERRKTGGWRLLVAIADVSHYVQVNSALDREAQVRGNSVYFPDHVIPMLPEALSNGLCSLNPDVDRLCMVCEMTISKSGRISGYKFYEGVMHSHARLTYTQVGQVIAERDNSRSGVRKQFHHLLPHLDELHNLYQVLRQAREQRGAIDFETTETRIVFDKTRKIERIVPVQRNDAHKLIEECMLCANVCAARFLEKHDLLGLYRVHEGPGEEKLNNLREFLGELGLKLGGGSKPAPGDYQTLLQSISDRADAHLIQTVMLRSLSQAVYQPENKGHFGLGYTAYTHFTSPIRRYPDLLTHRAIRHIIRSRKSTDQVERVRGAGVLSKKVIFPYGPEDVLAFGEQSSLTERRADDATRDVVSWLKCEYLQDHVGDVFDGVISAVTGFGLFVELRDLYVDGLVHITNLPHDYYHFEAAQHRLVGDRTRKVFRLGDELVVQVVRVDLDERKVDLELVEQKPRKRTKVSAKARELADEYADRRQPKAKKRGKGEPGRHESDKGRSGRRDASKGKSSKSEADKRGRSAGERDNSGRGKGASGKIEQGVAEPGRSKSSTGKSSKAKQGQSKAGSQGGTGAKTKGAKSPPAGRRSRKSRTDRG
ncbi:ribonuclease R [Exilibacterium tricleocarpae]|uniref:Ribonuclease R n=1 Tax=Exilibacterium tricleocarpae TaxID=2591008 RepID=A0A545SQL7_9GAMM|nr:ribonuclease R [Exilibacterium tricleocarpae]TQV67275.1 ribonuclease R [Exilibacterium tricleocarpae]